MTTPEFPYEKRDGIAYLTFNRPDKRNAISPEVICRLADAWQAYAADDSLRVAIITGAGDKAFSAGADLGRLTPPFPVHDSRRTNGIGDCWRINN